MGQYSPPPRDDAAVATESWVEAIRRNAVAYDDVPTCRRSSGSVGAVSGRFGALVIGAVVAAFGGLAWAGVVVVTRFDFGILAWLVGAAVGQTIFSLSGGSIGIAARIYAGVVAAVGIVIGKYVIFVHAVKVNLGLMLEANGVHVGYLDTRAMSIFVHHFGEIVRPIYALWVGLAFLAAVRFAGGRPLRRG